VQPLIARTVKRLPEPAQPGAELVARTIADAFKDRVPGLAAEMAFYLILSLPPLLITVFAGVALIGDIAGVEILSNAQQQILGIADEFLTQDTVKALEPVLGEIRAQAQDGIGVLFSFGFFLTLLSASRALRVTTVAITIAYDLHETRPGWKQYVYGVMLTLAALVIGIIVIPAFVGGPGLGRLIGDTFNLGTLFVDLWQLLYFPGVAIVITLLIALLYHVAAPWWTPLTRDLPGAALAMGMGLAGSYGLRLYTDRAIGDVFGALATPIVLLVWLFVMSLAVLIGAEFNAEIERMWPSKRPDQPTLEERQRVETTDRVS
jgi:membrane protein